MPPSSLVRQRYDVRPFAPELIDDAARLRADRHARQRLVLPALDPTYGQPPDARRQIEALLARDDASGRVVTSGGALCAFVLGTTPSDPPWGANMWVEDAGSASLGFRALFTGFTAQSTDGVRIESPILNFRGSSALRKEESAVSGPTTSVAFGWRHSARSWHG